MDKKCTVKRKQVSKAYNEYHKEYKKTCYNLDNINRSECIDKLYKDFGLQEIYDKYNKSECGLLDNKIALKLAANMDKCITKCPYINPFTNEAYRKQKKQCTHKNRKSRNSCKDKIRKEAIECTKKRCAKIRLKIDKFGTGDY